MRRLFATALPSTVALAQNRGKEPLVEFELMAWPEVKQAMESGKTTGKELGKKAYETKVEYAVRQIQTFVPPK
jgi:hypothetical protein